MPTIDEDEIPAFLKGGLAEADEPAEDDDDFDFPELEEDEDVAADAAADDLYQARKEAEADAADEAKSEEPHGKPGSNFGAEQLRAFIERIERLEEQKSGIASDIRDVYSEAKGTGFTPKTIRAVIKKRKQDPAVRKQEAEELDLYMWSIGMAE